MADLVTWLQATALSQGIVASPWLWPFCETLHFIGLALVIGIAGFFDLRLIGAFRQVSVQAAKDLMPLAMAGFAINLVTGIIFFIGHPEQYVENVSFWMKVVFLGIAGVNALMFETLVGRNVVTLPEGSDTPTAAKVAGVVSIVAWFGVLYWGRMLPFIGDAY